MRRLSIKAFREGCRYRGRDYSFQEWMAMCAFSGIALGYVLWLGMLMGGG